MEFVLLNSNLEQVYILDEYESLIWTDRYSDAGDFEIYTPINLDLLEILKNNQMLYLWSDFSTHLMVVEEYSIETNFDDGSKMTITGRSLESILDRRIIWDRVFIDGSLHDGIKQLVMENAISPSMAKRKIHRLYFKDSNDPAITEKTITATFAGDNLLDVVKELCEQNGIGFKIMLTESNQFEMSLYTGDDYSYDQLANPYVIFSPDFENLGSSNYVHSLVDYKNVVAVPDPPPEGQSEPNTHTEFSLKSYSGLGRREMVAEENGNSDEYDRVMTKKDLRNHMIKKAFEGEADVSRMFVYGKDFNIGDIVQIRNEYGIESAARVTELVMNKDQDTYEIYPTFVAIDEEMK